MNREDPLTRREKLLVLGLSVITGDEIFSKKDLKSLLDYRNYREVNSLLKKLKAAGLILEVKTVGGDPIGYRLNTGKLGELIAEMKKTEKK